MSKKNKASQMLVPAGAYDLVDVGTGKVIGLEFRITPTPWTNQQEVAIFPMNLKFPRALPPNSEGDSRYKPQCSITIHTAAGDLTLTGPLP